MGLGMRVFILIHETLLYIRSELKAPALEQIRCIACVVGGGSWASHIRM